MIRSEASENRLANIRKIGNGNRWRKRRESPASAVLSHLFPAPRALEINYFPGTVWENYERIDPVALIYGNGKRLEVAEYNSANRLLKELWRIGRLRLRIRGMISQQGSVPPLHLAALNCYLEHQHSAQSLDALREKGLHRFNWYALQRAVPLIWTR